MKRFYEICLKARYAVTPRRGVWGPECPELDITITAPKYFKLPATTDSYVSCFGSQGTREFLKYRLS